MHPRLVVARVVVIFSLSKYKIEKASLRRLKLTRR